MEYWSYVSGGKGFVSDESVSTPDAIARGKNGLTGWEFKTPFSIGSNMVCPSQEGIEKQGFVELGFPQMVRKSVSSGSIGDVLGSKVVGGISFNSVTATQNAFSEDEESSSKLSSSVVESNCRGSALIDLKLGRFADQRDAQILNSSKINPNLSSAESSLPAKRIRMGGFSSPTPLCQVHGCQKNLSSSKDYHKRHKVCEVHSKTAKVIVNGIEQRFCQQCSRFHLLAEFDDGKRSCRKRLAGHNARRRKPHVGVHSSRPGSLFLPYNSTREGSRVKGSTVAASSFICQDIFPSSLPNPHSQKYGTNEWWHIKLEDGTANPQSLSPITDGQLQSKSLYPSGFEKHCPPLHGNGVVTAIGSKFDGNGNRYPHDIGASNIVSRSFFQSSSIGGEEDFFIFDSASTVEGLSGIAPDAGRALSLLSSQSQSASCHSSRIPITQNVSGNLLGVSPQASVTGVSNNLYSSGISSVEETHLDPILISDDNDTANFGMYGIFQGSEYMNSKDQVCCEDGSTIDLLQLSSQLQRVEHQGQGLRVKQENDTFVGLRIT